MRSVASTVHVYGWRAVIIKSVKTVLERGRFPARERRVLIPVASVWLFLNDPDIDELFKAAKRRIDFYNRLPGVGLVAISRLEEREFEKLDRGVARAVAVLGEKYGKP
jgi:hypothetical protein